MKKKKPSDRLEDFFRNYFNDSKKVEHPNGWNVPSANVWDNIQMELAKEKKPERKFLYWQWIAAAASVLLLWSVFQLHQSSRQIQDLSKKIVKNDQVVQKLQADLYTLNKKKKSEDPSPKLATKESNNPNNTTKENNVFKNTHLITLLKSTSTNENLVEGFFDSNIAPVLLNKKAPNKSIQELNTSSLQKKKFLITNIPLEILPNSIPQLDIENRPINWSDLSISPILKKRPKLYFSADYSSVWTTTKNSGTQTRQNDFFPKREIQRTAYSSGFHFGIKLNKGWAMETGLRYSSIKKLIRHSRIIPYQMLEEQLNSNGNYESTINLQLGSSGGEIVNTDISLARSSTSTIASDASIEMDISYETERNYLEVPLIIRKEWVIGSFAFNLKSGLLNRFLLTSHSELQQVSIDDLRFNSRANNFRERPRSINDNNYSAHYMAGIGLEYAFQSDLSLYVEPTFIKNIQPIKGIMGANLQVQNKTLNIGLRYML